MKQDIHAARVEGKKKGGCLRNMAVLGIMACSVFFALVLAGYGLELMGFAPEPTKDNLVVIPSQTVAVMPSQTPIPLPTNTLIPSSSIRIEDVFLAVDGVIAVELASERDMETQVGAVALLTIDSNYPLEGTRDNIWDAWVIHARANYPEDRRLVLDLTINQGGVESIWQNTSNSTEWLRLK